MGKAIDALYDALILIEQDGGLFLDEIFMNGMFDKIHTDDSGICVALSPLVEAMKYQYERRQTNVIDGYKVLPCDQLNAELFYPKSLANVETTGLVKTMACEIVDCVLHELHDPKKATSHYLTSTDGKFSWGNTTDNEDFACLGMMGNNDHTESLCASLTHQLQYFWAVTWNTCLSCWACQG